ncbi:MAG: hypothetical protein F2837_10510 [Actinobacteria bacterium]|uniref:Unannotated protein n=1 Tax=freshwater metagenome TaxID=449393 RepID=A0A6J7KGJ1_9ZZZZ|nr:hypothetical protein [Actinomycetota bacterium]
MNITRKTQFDEKDVPVGSLVKRIPVVADWVVAVAVAIVIYNVHVTSAGAPLSGAGLSAGPTSAGITEAGRTTFYGALMITGAVIAAIGLLLAAMKSERHAEGALLSRSFAALCLVGGAGLLLDYRDGPVSWMHLGVYTIIVLALLRFVRVWVMLNGSPTIDTSL